MSLCLSVDVLCTLFFCFDICSSVLSTIYASEFSEFESDSFSNSCNCLTTISQKPSCGSKNWYEVAIFKQVRFKFRRGRWYFKSSISLLGKCWQTKTLSFLHESWYLFMSFVHHYWFLFICFAISLSVDVLCTLYFLFWHMIISFIKYLCFRILWIWI